MHIFAYPNNICHEIKIYINFFIKRNSLHVDAELPTKI